MVVLDGESDYLSPKLDERINKNGVKTSIMPQNYDSIVVAYQLEPIFVKIQKYIYQYIININ